MIAGMQSMMAQSAIKHIQLKVQCRRVRAIASTAGSDQPQDEVRHHDEAVQVHADGTRHA